MLFLVAAIFIHVVPGSFSWGFNLLPGDLGDTRFNQFVLEHGWRFLSGQVPSLWDAPIYYPFPKALALSDHLLGSQWLYAPWRLFGLDPDGALTGWLLSLFAINGLSCYVCLRFLGASPVASGLAAFPFACGLPVLAQIGHPQLLQLYPIPPALTFGLVLLKSAGRRGLAWCLGFLAWTFWCSPYLFVFTALLLALIWLWYLPDLADVLRRLAACPRDAARYAMSFLGFIVLLLPAAWPYFDISRQTGLRPFDEIAQMLPRPASLLAVNDASATWVATLAPFSVGLPMAGEHKIFPGAWV